MNLKWLRQVGVLLVVLSLTLSPIASTSAYALNAPTLIAPANTTTTTVVDTPPLGIPEFKWSAVTGATVYRLQVSSDIAFTSWILDINTPNTTYTPTNSSVFSDGTWYWRVRVESPEVSAFSSIWSFTKQWATPANLPALTAPDNGASLSFYDQPVFSWGAVTGAARYKLQIYSSPGGWGSPLYNVTTLATTHQPNVKQANGTYYWRVVPIDTGNRDGTPSSERSFTLSYSTAPTLLEPNDFATPTFTPTFRWSAIRGAQYYRLQYTTDPSFSSGVNQIDTRNTSYTPTQTLSNDVNYYWRVRVHSGESISNWSPSRTFVKKWYIKPTLLTPVNNYQHVRFPVFSWTPVPGASYYRVELSFSPGFSSIYDAGNTANTFYTPYNYYGGASTYYWRVTPYDGNGFAGSTSNTASYVSYYNSVAPQLVYPLFYYTPDNYPGYSGVTTNPHEDRTVPLPIFIWNRVYVPSGDANQGQVYAQAYRVQVSTDATFMSINWTVDTENLVAAPTTSNPFTPLTNTNYYWRVRPLIGGSLVGQWSQVWKTRFDPALGLPASTAGSAPSLIRPTSGFEFAETTPLLEWFPITGATAYDVQISQNEDFSATVDTATVSNPAYIPTQSLAQRNLGDVNFGIYYWRVRQSPSGAWSETRRFQIAAQSQWQFTRTIGNTANRLQIGSDPASDVATASYDLTNLQVAQSSGYWHFGFQVPSAPALNVTYALYLDTDHVDSSGAPSDARGYTLSTIPGYRPEYIVYLMRVSGSFSAENVFVYHWNGAEWDTVNILDSIGGQVYQTSTYVEIQIPNTAIGYQDTTGSYTAALFSLPASSGQPQDSVPANSNVPGSGPISRFSNVTERMNLSMPPNDAGVDPSTYPSVQPFFWDWPVLAPWSGAIMQAHLDPAFTSKQAEFFLTSDTAYFAQTTHAWEDDFSGDNTYFWRIQPRYRVGGDLYLGAWSQGWRFERKGFRPQNLATSVTFATPTFSWNMVEGAESYDLQVDDDPNFGSPQININTRQNSYTDANTLSNATYHWRVRVRRFGDVINNWTDAQSFTLTLPIPSGLTHTPSGVVGHAPTLCWTPLIANSLAGDPVLAAWRYRVQVSTEPTFSNIYDNIDTEQSCWTPTRGYDDGQYYWRVAMFDGSGILGQYSASTTFTKQYPISTLLSPASGVTLTSTPTFVWTAVPGAARYKFESSQNSNFSPAYESFTTDNTRWTPTTSYSPGATYYWRVAIMDIEGRLGPFVGATIILDDNGNPTPIFADVPFTHWAVNYIENLYLNGVTGGCSTNPLKYCPDTVITRAQLAVFLLKAKNGAAYTPPNATGTVFSDVPASHWAAKWIEALYAQGVTGGCSTSPLKYCPDKSVTREEMAVFILRMKHGSTYTPPPATGVFSDVPVSRWSARWVEQLAEEGITGGCGGGKFCPTQGVTRAQMAVFIVSAFNLP
ncbi:MAG: S-layer homology domain-containing protein [Chloroflexi bacterium]|nr:S-layer homology domain-containing protein [Chloroflexota bacterium]